MKIPLTLVIAAAMLISGCASVEMNSKEESSAAKKFNPPSVVLRFSLN